ncbi:MAG: nucleoside hydrolase [Rubripirellula sp.]|jgi:purine nucleosidase|nr:nucleoside hydrolase [Planctomycetaceae bacterium]MDF1840716.1 nucleoside hydrolase [Rubripirellula sp.]
MTRKIIIDCDPGIDDAVAICMALFDPRLDVLAITATPGTVNADRATANVTAIVNELDPPRYPRIGKAAQSEHPTVSDDSALLHGSDGLGGCNFATSARQHLPSSEKVISELLHQYPNEVTLVCLGPLTNLAKLCRLDPTSVELIDSVIISGGSVAHPGNATTVAERNMHFDPNSARDVFSSPTTKLLVPMDVTEQVLFGVELLEQIPDRFTRVGGLLHKFIPFAFRTAHQRLGRELIPLYDPTTLVSLLEPELFTWKAMAGRVETQGDLTRGMTVFDQRLRSEWPENMEVATDVDAKEAKASIIRSIRYAGQNT